MGRRMALTPDQLAQAHRLREAGHSQTSIAQNLSVSQSSVSRALRREDRRVDPLSHDAGEALEVPVIVRDYSHLDDLYVYPLGDVHLGAASHNSARWQEWVAYLQERQNTSLLGTGDFLNCAVIGSKSDVYDETTTVGEAKQDLEDDLKPLAQAGRVDVLMPGNHEDRIRRLIGMDLIADIARHIDVPYCSASCLLVYKVGSQTYEFYVRHGTGNGQSLVQLSKGAMVASADVYVTGHVHNIAARADEYFVREGDKVVRKRRYYVSSGSFLGYERYAAERGYVPTRLGAPRIFLDGERHDIHVSI
jgi:hypothetical protein